MSIFDFLRTNLEAEPPAILKRSRAHIVDNNESFDSLLMYEFTCSYIVLLNYSHISYNRMHVEFYLSHMVILIRAHLKVLLIVPTFSTEVH